MSDLLALGHGHHRGLISWGREREERLAQVRKIKPEIEWAARERCMWQLTPEQIAALPPDLVEARRAYDEASRAYDEASRAYVETEVAHRDELEAWHARHCPALRTKGCPWDGERLIGVGE
jgi:hypothetical protein